MNKAHKFKKIEAITIEIEASFKLIAVGLKNLNEQTSFVSNNHVPLKLLSSGFERVIKILLLLKDKHLTGNYPELQKAKDKFNLGENYGMYSFRHTFITKLYVSLRKLYGTPFEAKSKLMIITGHTSMIALEKYLRDIDGELPEDFSEHF